MFLQSLSDFGEFKRMMIAGRTFSGSAKSILLGTSRGSPVAGYRHSHDERYAGVGRDVSLNYAVDHNMVRWIVIDGSEVSNETFAALGRDSNDSG